MNKVFLVLLLIVGLINFLPVVGVLSAAKLSQAYSIDLASNDLIILMRHRALLFGLVGGFVFYSLFMPQFQPAAMLIAAISMIGYLVIMWMVGDYNDSIFKVAIVDMVGIVALGLAVLLKYVFMRG
jgi:hypothetical protein